MQEKTYSLWIGASLGDYDEEEWKWTDSTAFDYNNGISGGYDDVSYRLLLI